MAAMSSLMTKSLRDDMPSSTSGSKNADIASQVCRCLRLFENAVTSLISRTADLPFESLLDQIGRFRLWSNEVGAHKDGNESLQHRLDNAPRLRQGIIDLLQDLDIVIEKTIQILEGKTPPWEDTPDSNESDSDSDSASDERSDNGDDQTELAQLYTNIVEINTCLMRTSASIDNSTLERHSIKFRDERSFDDVVTQQQIYAIYDMFPKAPQYLVVRLAAAYDTKRKHTDLSGEVPPFVRRPACILFRVC
jgi:hypothetical protein